MHVDRVIVSESLQVHFKKELTFRGSLKLLCLYSSDTIN